MLRYLQSKKGFTLIELMVVVAVIGTLAAIAIPQYMNYIKRSRSSSGVMHSRMICNAMADWYSAPNMSDGDLGAYPPIPGNRGKDGLLFDEHFPSETLWLTSLNGDGYYTYAVVIVDPSSPEVVADAVNPTEIYAQTVQAGGKGAVTGLLLSGCKSNIERVSATY